MLAMSIPALVPVIAGALYGIANVIKLFTKPNTLAFKISDKVLTVGPDLVSLFGVESALAGGSSPVTPVPPAAK